jgi:hypothetical protein
MVMVMVVEEEEEEEEEAGEMSKGVAPRGKQGAPSPPNRARKVVVVQVLVLVLVEPAVG